MCTHTREYTASVRLLRSVRLCTLFVHRAAHIITTHARTPRVCVCGLPGWCAGLDVVQHFIRYVHV